jgi:hypothetical protein
MAAEAVEQAEQQPEEHEWPEVDFDRVRRFVIQQQGRDHVLFSGLIEALHQVSGGYFAIDTRVEQLPSEQNGQVAVVSARVQVFDPDNPDLVRRSATGIGDASPGNVNRMMAGATIRMAETRAKARALRDLCNVAMVALEELGPQGPEDHPEKQPVATEKPFTPRGSGPPERIMIAGRAYTRPQVWAAYRQRVAEARAAGLVLPDDQADLREDAPLSAIAGASQSIRRRLEARDGTGK